MVEINYILKKFKNLFIYILHNTPIGAFLCKTSLFWYRTKPIAVWPGWIGFFINVKLPKSSKSFPAPRFGMGSNINIVLELLKKTAEIKGDIVECGVFQGATLAPIGVYVKQNLQGKKVFGLDTYEGFDDGIIIDIDIAANTGKRTKEKGFGQTSVAYVWRRLDAFGITRNVSLVAGLFSKTLPLLKDKLFSFVHLDCDLYQSYKECLDFFYPRMIKGGIILFDEYNDPNWPGCNKAVDEFLVEKSEGCIEINMNNYVKYYIRKQ